MEGLPNFEAREEIIDGLVEDFAARENLDPDFVISDIIMFAPFEGNELVSLEYLSEIAEKIGISTDEMHAYALKKVSYEQ